jgi:hypothetical protein
VGAGSIAGDILGAIHGVDAIPARWLRALELRAEIAQLARDLAFEFCERAGPVTDDWWTAIPVGAEYPGRRGTLLSCRQSSRSRSEFSRSRAFKVRIRHGGDRRDMRSDKENVKQYGFKRALKHSKNVKDWRDGRFARTYPGLRRGSAERES